MSDIHHDNTPENNHGRVQSSATSGTVSETEYKAGHQTDTVEPFKDNPEDGSNSAKKIIGAQTAGQNFENEEEVANHKPSEDHVDSLIDEFDEEHNLAQETVIGAEELVKVSDGVDGGEKL